MLAVVALVVGIYAPAIGFGLIWDDPTWYSQGADLAWWQLFGPVPTFQFYRPLTLLYNRLFASKGRIYAEPMHLLQIVYHAINTVLCMHLARRCGLSRLAATLAGLVLALHPYAQQAVAWQAPQQPLVTLLMLVMALATLRHQETGRGRWLALSCGCFVLGLFVQEVMLGALLIVAALHWECWSAGQRVRRPWALTLYVIGALLFASLYMAMPKRPGIVGTSKQIKVLAYLLQAFAPPTGILQAVTQGWDPWLWALLLGAFWGGVALLALRRSRRAATLGVVWFALGIAPPGLRLPWSYVELGSRLVYPALPGIALIWAAALGGDDEGQGLWLQRGPRRLLAVLLIVLLARQTVRLQHLWREASGVQRAAIDTLATHPEQELLFVNYPDRIALARPPYVLGYWGIILAPPVQELSDFAEASRGVSGVSKELARLDVAHIDWRSSPYVALFRGDRVSAAETVATDRWHDAVYITLVSDQGALELRQVGWSAAPTDGSFLARLGDTLYVLHGEAALQGKDTLRVEIALASEGALVEDDVVFLHLVRPDGLLMRQFDDDLWGGFVPANTVPAGVVLGEVRHLDIQGLLPGDYAVVIGLYNRDTGQRYVATWADGYEAWNGMLQIDTLHLD